MTRQTWILVALLGATLGAEECGGAPEDLLRNPGFDQWCMGQPCAWDVVEGDAVEVTTWHELDRGVALIGESAVLEQRISGEWDASANPRCFLIELTGSIATEVTIGLDFDDDGIDDWSARVGGQPWTTHQLELTPPQFYGDLVFRLVKGEGPTKIGHVRLIDEPDLDACPFEPVHVPWPLGFPCDADDECGTGHCGALPEWGLVDVDGTWVLTGSTCAQCSTDDDCDADWVCGLVQDDEVGRHRACEPPAMATLGEACVPDAECASGICTSGRCSECGPEHTCDDDATCSPRVLEVETLSFEVAHMCDGAPRATGEPCLDDTDCEAQCLGESLHVNLLTGATCVGEACDAESWFVFGVSHGVCG